MILHNMVSTHGLTLQTIPGTLSVARASVSRMGVASGKR